MNNDTNNTGNTPMMHCSKTREYLCSVYLDWINNYASVDTYAEHNQLTYKQAFDLIALAKDVYNAVAPDA